MRPLRVTRSGIVGSVLVLAVAAGCVRLGIWQLHRLAERRARNAVVSARMNEPPLSLTSLPADTTGLAFRRAAAAGSWDDERTIVYAGRSYDGEPGVYLLTPLRLAGAANGQVAPGAGAILVNRGYVPSPDAATVDLRRWATSSMPAAVTGILLPIAAGSVAPPPTFKRTWFRLDATALASQFPYPLAPMVLQVVPAHDTRALPRPIPPPALDEGPHLGYAIQWFGFATIGIVGWVVMLLRRGGPPEYEAPPAPE